MRRLSRHGETGEGHLAAHQQGHLLVDDLLGLEVGAVGPEDPDDPPVGMVQPGHGPQQGGLAGAVGAQQGEDLPLGDLEVDVEQHLVGAVEEVEVVDLQGRHRPAGLAALALGMPFEDVLDDQGDVPLHVPGADEQHEPADGAHRADQGQGHRRPVAGSRPRR